MPADQLPAARAGLRLRDVAGRHARAGTTRTSATRSTPRARCSRTGRPTVPDVIIFMTDGQANQPSSMQPCGYFNNKATTAKDAGQTIFTIAYGLSSVNCASTDSCDVPEQARDDQPRVRGDAASTDDLAGRLRPEREQGRRPLLLHPGHRRPRAGVPPGGGRRDRDRAPDRLASAVPASLTLSRSPGGRRAGTDTHETRSAHDPRARPSRGLPTDRATRPAHALHDRHRRGSVVAGRSARAPGRVGGVRARCPPRLGPA